MTRFLSRIKPGLAAMLAAPCLALGVPQSALAQQTPAEAAAVKAAQITEARKKNAALMRQYTWDSRTELIESGAIKDNRLELVHYAPDGTLQRSLLNDSGASLPRGFLRRAVAANRKKELEGYLTGLRSLLEQYTLSTTGKVLDFMTSAMPAPDATGLLQMTGNSVVVPGDSLTVSTDPRTLQTRRVQVNSSYQGNAVQLTATFNTIPSGLTYMAYAEVTVPAKQMSVQVQNFNYTRPN
jgi:hypothetical protein